MSRVKQKDKFLRIVMYLAVAVLALPNIHISKVFASRNPIFSLSLSLHP